MEEKGAWVEAMVLWTACAPQGAHRQTPQSKPYYDANSSLRLAKMKLFLTIPS